jgi:hypothetical protein
MVKNERIFKFPYPDWINLIPQKLKYKFTCLCYQSNFDIHGYGPYGFDTNNSKQILNEVFDEISIWDNDKISYVNQTKINHYKGIFLYGNGIDYSNEISKKITQLKILNKKENLQLKKLNHPPKENNSIEKFIKENNSIKNLIKEKISFAVTGVSTENYLVTMDENISSKVEEVSKKYGVEFISINAESDLKPW